MFADYDPAKTVLNFAGIPITGYAPGTFVRVEYDGDMFTKKTGPDGHVTRSKTNNKGGKVTFILQHDSPSNTLLSGVALLDKMTGDGVSPVLVKTTHNATIATGDKGWIIKNPGFELGDEPSDIEWVIDVADLDVGHQGAMT